MVKVKPLDRISKNFEASIGEAARRYREEVAATSGVIQAAIDAQDKYVAAVTNPENQARRVKNLQKTTDEEWRRKATTKGSANIAVGMRESVAEQREGFRPYAEALSGLDLGPKGLDPIANVDRVVKVVQVMIAKKKEIG